MVIGTNFLLRIGCVRILCMLKNVRVQLVLIFLGILFLTMLPSAASAAMLGRWKLDEGTGSTANDSSGNGKHGSWSGTSSGNTGYYDTNATTSFSYSGSFSSGDDQVLVTGITTVVKSVTFWAYIPSLSGTTEIVSKSSSGQGFEVIINGGTIQFYTMGSDVVAATASSANINLNAWNHIVATYNGGGTTMRVYVNGALSGSTATAPATVTNVENLYFGTWGSGGRQFEGKLNDVRLYDVELSLTQVNNVMGGSTDPDTPPDSTAPTISSIASSTNATGATITWTTNEAASTKVVYSVNTQYASSTAEADTGTRVTSHSQALSNLLGCTQYNFKVVSRDAAGNSATSSGSTFLTTGCAGSVTPSSATSTVVTVNSAATSTLTDSSRTITVASPANFTNASTSVVIQIKGLTASTVIDSIGKPSSSLLTASGIVFDVTALIDGITRVESFDSPVTITYAYTDNDISGIDESTLKVYRYSNSAWSELSSCSVNTSANTITCSTSGFSVFGVFGTAPQSSSSSSTSSSSQKGASIKTRVANLIAMGKTTEAQALKNEWSWLFTDAPSTQTSLQNTFTRDLKLGMKGKDVMDLQKKLNSLGFKIALSGPGSTGMETEMFGSLTRAALIAYQKAYKISPAVGYFGPLTRAHMASINTN